jgi:hypothetical protein
MRAKHCYFFAGAESGVPGGMSPLKFRGISTIAAF